MMTDVVIGERCEEVMPQKYPMLMIDSLDSWEFDGAGPSPSGVPTDRFPPGRSSRSWRRR